MNELLITSKIRDYKVVFEDEITGVLKAVSAMTNKVLIVDENVLEINRKDIVAMAEMADIIPFQAIEGNKNLDAVVEIYSSLIDRNAKRNINLVSIGGGITQDVTGFVASTLYRGINWTFVPTTFLAQTDSCIGSKTSLNFQNRKNLLGTFYPPSQIYLCPAFLSSLSEIDFYSGIGETLKFQLMNPFVKPDLLDIANKIEKLRSYKLLEEVIRENMAIKVNYMENDEFDLGRRNLLNYGHCFGHALEISSEYAIPHGIAVSIGILYAGIVSVMRGILNREVFEAISAIVLPCLPVKYDKRHYDPSVLLSALKNDKKRTGSKLSIVLADNNFMLNKYDDLDEKEFYEALQTLIETLER